MQDLLGVAFPSVLQTVGMLELPVMQHEGWLKVELLAVVLV